MCSSMASSAIYSVRRFELFPTRAEAEAVVQAWDRDEPDQVGALHVELIEIETGVAN
jgi:hypothetical protein